MYIKSSVFGVPAGGYWPPVACSPGSYFCFYPPDPFYHPLHLPLSAKRNPDGPLIGHLRD